MKRLIYSLSLLVVWWIGAVLLSSEPFSSLWMQPATPIETPEATPAAAADSEWPVWVKREEPLYSGQFSVASDPVVLHEADGYRMVYTCMDFLRDTPRAILCEATSPDGFAWEPVETDPSLDGLILRGRDGEWDENLEAAYLIHYGDEYLLYYSGYQQEGDPAMGYPAALALAVSADGIHFERMQSEPILSPTAGGYDNDAIYSPVIFEYDGQLMMIYVGHCYSQCDYAYGTTLLAATSPDGRTWTKREEPVLTAMPDDVPWTRDGVAEPAVVLESDGRITLFFTSVRDKDRWIGMARSESPFGPWDVDPEPILKPTAGSFDAGGVLAPHVIIEDGMAQMWYLGTEPVENGELFHVGYAEAKW
jgi:predicted GH43/DUF377 family glycosyl hydrolase